MVLPSRRDLETLGSLRICREFFVSLGILDKSVEHVAFLIGVVTGGEAVVHRIVWGCNMDLERGARFTADPWSTGEAVFLAEARGEVIVAVFHAHPRCPAVPSELDGWGARYWPTVWLISGVDGVRAWVPSTVHGRGIVFREIRVIVDDELSCYECLPSSCKPACGDKYHQRLEDHEYRG